MLLAAGLTAYRHWIAPWLMGILGVGMIIWILVRIAVMPETMILTRVFVAVGFISLFWLRRTGHLSGVAARGVVARAVVARGLAVRSPAGDDARCC